MEGRPLPGLEEHPDGHKDPERLKAVRRDLDHLITMKRASHAHEYYSAIDSTGTHKETKVMKRSPSAEILMRLGAYQVMPAQVKITLCMGGNRDNDMTVSERTTRDELRRLVSTFFNGRCSVDTDQFPLRDGTEVRAIPVFLPFVSEASTMETVVPYLTYGGHIRPVEVSPVSDDAFLARIAESYIDQPGQVSVPHQPIRNGDTIQIITASDAQIKQEVKLQALREDDKVLPPAPTPSVPPTMQQLRNQAPPRAHSREIQLPWEIGRLPNQSWRHVNAFWWHWS
jgi:hypothetical protein